MLNEAHSKIDKHIMGKSKIHLLEKFPIPNGKKDCRRICKICSKKTWYFCTKCTFENGNYIALCIPECFLKNI